MKKELRIFLILILGWIFLLDFAILRTQINNYITSQNSIIIRNVISGAAVYYPLDNSSVFSGLVLPLILYNSLIIIFLSLSYYFWIKSKNKITKTKSYNKKGQAAMEFMMTYGWAVMALVVSFAALYSFGVILKPSGQDMCALSPGIICKEFIVGNNGIAITVNNGLSNNINNVRVNITNIPGSTCTQSIPKSITDGGTMNFGLNCSGLKTGNKFKGDISITYLKEGASLTSTSSGTINSKVTNTPITIETILTGMLTVTTNKDPGVSIYDGAILLGTTGMTGLTYSGLSIGSHTFKATKTGYNDGSKSGDISNSTTLSLTFELTEIPVLSCKGTPYHPNGELGSGPLEHYVTCTEISNQSICIQVVGCYWG
jgi:hypothetical protein